MILLFFSHLLLYLRNPLKKSRPKKKQAGVKGSLPLNWAIWPLMFPIIIVGGIYGGVFSPTEAAAICVLYAIILEFGCFRFTAYSQDIYVIAKSTGSHYRSGLYFGRSGEWFFMDYFICTDTTNHFRCHWYRSDGPLRCTSLDFNRFFVACMFVDPIVVILVLNANLCPRDYGPQGLIQYTWVS